MLRLRVEDEDERRRSVKQNHFPTGGNLTTTVVQCIANPPCVCVHNFLGEEILRKQPLPIAYSSFSTPPDPFTNNPLALVRTVSQQPCSCPGNRPNKENPSRRRLLSESSSGVKPCFPKMSDQTAWYRCRKSSAVTHNALLLIRPLHLFSKGKPEGKAVVYDFASIRIVSPWYIRLFQTTRPRAVVNKACWECPWKPTKSQNRRLKMPFQRRT